MGTNPNHPSYVLFGRFAVATPNSDPLARGPAQIRRNMTLSAWTLEIREKHLASPCATPNIRLLDPNAHAVTETPGTDSQPAVEPRLPPAPPPPPAHIKRYFAG